VYLCYWIARKELGLDFLIFFTNALLDNVFVKKIRTVHASSEAVHDFLLVLENRFPPCFSYGGRDFFGGNTSCTD
jgi:hypothetical protein